MIRKYLDWTIDSCNKIDPHQVQNLVDLLMNARKNKQGIFVVGNGGSAATASHLSMDLGKGTLRNPVDNTRFRINSLTDNLPYLTAWANDFDYEQVFEQQLRNLSSSGDMGIGISASGNRPNILRAIEYGKSAGLVTVGMTGFSGGKLKKIADHVIHIPVNDYGMVENMHMIIVHIIVTQTTARVVNGE